MEKLKTHPIWVSEQDGVTGRKTNMAYKQVSILVKVKQNVDDLSGELSCKTIIIHLKNLVNEAIKLIR